MSDTINKLLNLGSDNTKVLTAKVKGLQATSAGILNVFTATKMQLEQNNQELLDTRNELNDEIRVLRKAFDDAGDTIDNNDKVITKIDEFLN